MSITEKRLKELRERLDAAMKDWSNQNPASNQVWNFFAHAPTDLADLLAEIHRLRDELAKVREVTEEKVEAAKKATDDHWDISWSKTWACSCGFSVAGTDGAAQNKVLRHIARLGAEAVLGGGDDA